VEKNSLMTRIKFILFLKYVFYGFILTYIGLIFKEIAIDTKGMPFGIDNCDLLKSIFGKQNFILLIVILISLFLFFRQRIVTILKSPINAVVCLSFLIGIPAAMLFNARYPFNVLEISCIEPVLYGIKSISFFISLFSPICVILKAVLWKTNKSKVKSKDESTDYLKFLSDDAIENDSDDFLGFKPRVEAFSERLLNDSSQGNNVFGLDAPWGSGKTSFVNLCKNCIKEKDKEKDKEKVIFYDFSPISFSRGADIRTKFIDGISEVIEQNFCIPEFRPLFGRFARIVTIKPKVSFLGFEFERAGRDDYDRIHDELKRVLENIPKRIIVIIDDLDRVEWEVIKDLLNSIKKEFDLPNISFILCYDTENILKQIKDDDAKNYAGSFLEKFINLKSNLVVSCEDMKNYYESYVINKTGKNKNELSDESINKTLKTLDEIFVKENFENYKDYIGNARKIKRLINTVLFLKINSNDIEYLDIIETDLLHVLILYIWHPDVYLEFNNFVDDNVGYKAYKMRNYGRYEENKKDFIRKYNNFQKKKFILERLFFPQFSKRKMNEQERKSFKQITDWVSFFNKPEITEQDKYYSSEAQNILNDKNIKDVLEKDKIKDDPTKHAAIFKSMLVIVQYNYDTKYDSFYENIIQYVVEHLNDYPINDIISSTGSKTDITNVLLKMLNQNSGALRDPNNLNRKIELKKIGYMIYGMTEDVNDKGILGKIAAENKGILGFYDLMKFRLYCSAAFDIDYVTRALLLHANEQDTGEVSDLIKRQLRELSQKVFELFNEIYIKNGINIFEEFNNLKFVNLCGKFYDFCKTQIKDDEEAFVKETVSNIKNFFIYQMGTAVIKNSVGCGYYDPEGKDDGHGINKKFNKYLFEVCFNSKSDKNVRYFHEYCMSIMLQLLTNHGNYEWDLDSDMLCNVLEWKRLLDYWKSNKIKIAEIHNLAEGRTEQSDKLFEKFSEFMDKNMLVEN